jgi:orotidine-5'-phosphate decarboxylase
MTHNPVIIALDFNNAAQARAMVDTLGDSVDFYKVGMELYAAEGIAFARELVDRGKNVFLDLKLYDIGETVKRAVAVVARWGVRFLTVHGSKALLRAAIDGRGDANLKLLAVTVLTSFNEQDLSDLGYETSVGDLVVLLARAAVDCGVDGVVCSPLEAARVRQVVGRNMVLVTPGVRSRTAGAGDQKRIATPAEAVAAGADYLVIGRQVTRAANPKAEVEKIVAEIESQTPPHHSFSFGALL